MNAGTPQPSDLQSLQAAHPGWANYLLIAVATGRMTEQEAEARFELDREVARLRTVPDNELPCPPIAWSSDPASWRHSLDGKSQAEFDALFPSVIPVTVDLEELLANLNDRSTPADDIFSTDHLDKTLRLIAYLLLDRQVSPPIVTHEADGLFIAGGNHRLAWAKETGERDVPILIRSGELDAMRSKLSSLINTPFQAGFRHFNQGHDPLGD